MGLPARARIGDVAHGVGDGVHGEDEGEEHHGGRGQVPPDDGRARQLVARLVDHLPPAAVDADAEIGQDRLRQHQAGEGQGEGDDHEMGDVGQDVAHDDAKVGYAERARRRHVLGLAQLQRLAAGDAAEVDPAGHAQRHAHLQGALAQHHDERDQQ